MPLALKSTVPSSWAAIAGSISGLLPRIPEIRVKIPNPFAPASEKQIDPRLQELAEALHDGNSKAPFFIDNGILLAVPKKKVSHAQKRQKLYAPARKQLKRINNLNRCPSCGHVKRSHFLCMNCYFEIKRFLVGKKENAKEIKPNEVEELDPVDERILYPGKHQSADELKLATKDYVPKRPKSLPFEFKNK